MGFSIAVKKPVMTPCPHCDKPILHKYEELYYCQSHFFKDYRSVNMRDVLNMTEYEITDGDEQWYSRFDATGENAISMINKIKHLIDKIEYIKIIHALKADGAIMSASW